MRHRFTRKAALVTVALAATAGSVVAIAIGSGAGNVLDSARGHQTQTRHAK